MTTIVTSLVAGSLAGLPLSNKGLAQQLGLTNVASAATVSPYDAFMARLSKIHDALLLGEDAQSVRDLRDEIAGLSNTNAINPLWSYVPAAVKNDADVDFKQVLFDTFQALGSIMYSTRDEEITEIRSNSDLQAALVELADITGTQKLTVEDLLAFINAVEVEAVNQVRTNLTDLLLDHSSSFVSSLLKASVKEVLSSDTLEVSKVLNWFKDNTDATSEELTAGLTDTFDNFTTALPSGSDATQALMIAFIRAEAKPAIVSNGRTKSYSLKIENIAIPNELLEWTVSGSEAITVGENGTVVLANSATAGTGTIQATLLNKVVYSGTVNFSISTGGGVVTPSTPSALDQLKDLKDKIANATGDEKAKLIHEAVNKAAAAINALSTVKLNTTVSNGFLSAMVDNDALDKQLASIKEIIDALKDAAPGADKALPKLYLKLSVPAQEGVTSAGFGIYVSAAVKAAAAGVAGLEYNVLGFTGQFSLSQYAPTNTGSSRANRAVNFAAKSLYEATPVVTSADETINFTVKTSTVSADVLGSKKAASDVYEISLTAGGKSVDLAGKPVKLSFPLKDTTGLDKDLLTVAKIADGKLSIEGGALDGNALVEQRDTLGSFVVVENKVEFNDVSKVKAWAGRQIQVLAAKGAIEGRKAGAFAPNGEVTRAEFAKMLIHALDLDKTAVTGKFTDVKVTDWFAPYVAAAVDAGIINGRTETTFVPNATITRAEMAVMVARALEATKGVKTSADDLKALQAFKDAGDINASLKDGVAFAANKGLVVGDKGKFAPNATATRAQAAVIIYRAFNFKG